MKRIIKIRCINLLKLSILLLLGILPLASCKKEVLEEGHTHTKIHVPEQKATCVEEGHIEYWYCSKCKKVYKDRETTKEITINDTILMKIDHTIVEDEELLPTCDTTGFTSGSHCSFCGEIIVAQESLPELHHTFDLTEVTWVWQDYTQAELVLSCKNNAEHKKNHRATITSQTEEATCTEPGKITYTASVLLDGKEYTNQREDILLPTNHTFDLEDISWIWETPTTAHVQIPCRNNPKHILKYDASMKEEVIPATCTAPGNQIITATIYIQGQAYTDVNEVELPALGHSYDFSKIIWTWNEYTSATATLICKTDPTHIKTIDATVTQDILPASCLTEGTITHYATLDYEGTSYTNQLSETLPAIGHAFDYEHASWTWEGHSKASASFTCKHDETHKESYIAELSSQTIQATCVSEGKVTYTASLGLQDRRYEDFQYEILPIDPSLHEYDEEAFQWTWIPIVEGYEVSMYIPCKCGQDILRFEKLPVHKKTTLATFMEEGAIAYTVEVEWNGKRYKDTKEEKLPMKQYVSTEEEFLLAIAQDSYDLTLSKDILLSEDACLQGNYLAIDLNGYTLSIAKSLTVSATHATLENGFIAVDFQTYLESYALTILDNSNVYLKDIATLGGIHIQQAKAILNGADITATDGYVLWASKGSHVLMQNSIGRKHMLSKEYSAFFFVEEELSLAQMELYTTVNLTLYSEAGISPAFEEEPLLHLQTIQEYLESPVVLKCLALYEDVTITEEVFIEGNQLLLDLNGYTLSAPTNSFRISTKFFKVCNGNLMADSAIELATDDFVLKIEKDCNGIVDTIYTKGNIKVDHAKVSFFMVYINAL